MQCCQTPCKPCQDWPRRITVEGLPCLFRDDRETPMIARLALLAKFAFSNVAFAQSASPDASARPMGAPSC